MIDRNRGESVSESRRKQSDNKNEECFNAKVGRLCEECVII